ncbi:MAG: hypothetical protein ACI8W7_000901 [Gammaproteobacteria bacterium]|jgi:hypothetical protein
MDGGSVAQLSGTIATDRRATQLAWPQLLQTISGTRAILGARMIRHPSASFILTRVLKGQKDEPVAARKWRR